MAKFLPLHQAVAENLHDGDTVAFEGFTHLIPTAAAHEAIRPGFRDLTLIRMTPDLVYDQMIGMGAVFRGYRGAELAEVNPNIKSVTCPFTGEVLAAVPSVRPDVTFIHAQKANRKGDVLVEGIIGIQKEAVLAAKRAVVTVEEVVDDFDDLHPNLTVLPHWTITAISVVPGGSHPSYTHGYYGRDNAAYLEWDEIAADRQRFRDWMQKNVVEASPEVFAKRVAGLRKAA
jgi:glutaconate CoA-transferase subunit A